MQERIIQLDGLRAIAVIGVMMTHFLHPDNWIRKLAPWGELGVNLFFVLSGFLITNILIKIKTKIHRNETSIRKSLFSFYGRRIIRLSPVYYITLAVLFLVNYQEIRSVIWWHILYCSNVKFVMDYPKSIGHVAHFWTLSIEEQFYLFFPLFVLMIPKRFLERSFLILIVLAPLSRLLLSLALPENHLARVLLLPTCLDSLGCGAYLSLRRDKKDSPICNTQFYMLSLSTLVITIVANQLRFIPSGVETVFMRTIMAVYFFCLIDSIVGGVGVAIPLLRNRFFVYLGTISYGVYIVHHFVPALLTPLMKNIGSPWIRNTYFEFVVFFIASVAIASFLWHWVEKPLLGLKQSFKYH